MHRKTAFTYVELMIVITVVAILTLAAVTSNDSIESQQGDAATKLFKADVSFTKSLSIARPDDPAIIKVDPENNRYWIARESDPDTPITHPRTKKPYIVRFGPGGIPGFDRVRMALSDFGGDGVLKFDGFGGTDQDTEAHFRVVAGETGFEVAVAPHSSETAHSTVANAEWIDDVLDGVIDGVGGLLDLGGQDESPDSGGGGDGLLNFLGL